ncbi:SMI1/KNR4 family protein [Chitinophaga sp. sic0106]|uniref:SMI1/KNR4 family protein n=1 Tax=Chitinophaga sp. sic0106 TaxID=2854785 RepID=UPI001C45DED5|nr:SMI1/KNR4 family protein [Chitinophaga sp. sic0106]MBV7530362.1 SMI1/KNR4 family protein [Chitinophaga sp. sic0106]
MMQLPAPIQEILTAAICPGDICLPAYYPVLDSFESLQVSFRTHGHTGEDLTGTTSGQWQPGWYVIALNGMDDPFFVDLTESDADYPVYYAPHGAGRWDAVVVAPDAAQFIQLMRELEKRHDDQEATLAYLREQVDVEHNELWQEVYANAQDRGETADESTPVDMSEWIAGSIVITELGPDKMKLIQLLKETLNITNAEALALSKKKEITYKQGYLLHLKPIVLQLQRIGAAAEFRADN